MDKSANTPSRKVERFLTAWKDRNWQGMVDVSQQSWKAEKKNPVDYIDGMFSWIELHDFSVGGARLAHDDDATAPKIMSDVSIYLRVTFGHEQTDKNIHPTVGYFHLRAVCESAPYRPSADGVWGVNPSSLRRAEEGPRF